jgi:hypothetical protein
MRRRERPPMPWSPVRTVVVKKSAHMPEAAGVRRVEVRRRVAAACLL